MKIGIDIGGSHIGVGLVKDDGKLISQKSIDIDIAKLETEIKIKNFILESIYKMISDLLKKQNLTIKSIEKIGIAAPGNPSKTELRNLVNLRIKSFDIGKILKEKYHCPVSIKNDGKCAGIAEKQFGALKNYNDAVFLCIGTGVGSAVFLQGKLLEPTNNSGFELGHIVIEKGGNYCNCGNYGCFETYASMKRFKEKVKKELSLPKDMKSEEIQKYIRENIEHKHIKALVDEYIDYLGCGIANIVNIFEPEAIAIGGSFVYYHDIFIPKLQKKLKEYRFNKESEIDIICAKLMNEAGIIGSTEI